MPASKEKIDIQGDISIHTENILPIIKKWLYSDHEIFLRELVSNAFDAITKLNKIVLKDGLKDIDTAGKINIAIDAKQKTVTVSDNGIGMTADEIQKYINQIAFSGAEEFIQKYKDSDPKKDKDKAGIIGHFGLGFYSSFMVADKVEIVSKSFQKDSQAVRWTCDGSTHFEIHDATRESNGTDIILHINADNKGFLEASRIQHLVKKYSNYLPVEITVDGAVENDQNPLWLKQPNEVTEEEYKAFYQKLFPFSQEPLFWIHLNVEYPFNLKGILYFPKLLHELDSQKGQVKLFCQQVFVSDDAKAVIPEFLTLLQGAIDCPEIPLNVSRSYLQNDPYVQKISKHIVKKVADKLNQLYKKEPENFEKYWEDINPFIKFGMMNSDDFYDKVKDSVIFPSSTGKHTSIPDYLERNKDKNKDTVLYCTDKESQASLLRLCQSQELEVVMLNSVIDSHFIQFLESKNTEVKFKSIDSDLTDQLVDQTADAKVVDKDNKTADDRIKDLFENHLDAKDLKLEVKALKADDVSAVLLQSEHAKRFKDMSVLMKGAMPSFDDFTLVVNSNSPVVQKLSKLSQSPDKADQVKLLCEYVYDLARIGQNQLTGEQMQAFIARSNQLLGLL